MTRFFMRFHRLWLAGVFALMSGLGMSVLFAGVASAHASYVSSNPAAGSVVATAPTQITVHFAENVNPQGKGGVPSSLTVWHEQDAKNIYSFDEEAKQVSPANGTQFPLSNAKTMTINMTGDGNGIYAVSWYTVSADDGDPDSGVFFFGVGNPHVLGVTAVSSAPTNTASSGTPVWVPILVGILALLIGGAIGAGLARRRPADAAPSVAVPSDKSPV